MKSILLFLAFLGFQNASTAQSGTSDQFLTNAERAVPANKYVPGQILLKLKPEYRYMIEGNRIMDASLRAICQEAGMLACRPLFPKHIARPQQKVDLSLMYELRFRDEINVLRLCKRLMSVKSLAYAEPRHYAHPLSMPPNDSLYPQQKAYLDRIFAQDAWQIEQGDSTMVIAIVDTGVDFLHPDLIGNLARNAADPINGLDDDGNGFVDDYHGWDFGDNDNDPGIPIANLDLHHGTWVAGAAAASTNNILGIASMGYNCRFLPVKTTEDAGLGYLTYGYEGVVYAADLGAKVINCSWGDFGRSEFAADIIRYAVLDRDAFVVCAAGNYAKELDLYPASYEYAFCVAATDTDDKKLDYSSYNHLVDLSCTVGGVVIRPGGIYANGITGTSLSSPLVAGAAALLRHHFPGLNAVQTGELLRRTADPVDQLNPGYSEKLGQGRLNVFKALTATDVHAVRFNELHFTDQNDEIFEVGDTIRVLGNFINLLNETNNLTITLSTEMAGITLLQNVFSIAEMGVLETLSNQNNPFSFIITEAFASDARPELRIGYEADNYNDWQWIRTPERARVSYRDIKNDRISTSVNSSGRFGIMYDNNEEGLGFRYFSKDSIGFRMTALMIGNNIARVSDAGYGEYPVFDKDFKVVEPVSKLNNSPLADQVYTCSFNDSLAPGISKLGISVQQEIYLWQGDNFLISAYELTNHSNTNYQTLYVGLQDEIDLGHKNTDHDRNDQDSSLRMGYQAHALDNQIVAGIKLLSPTPFVHYAYEWNTTYGGIDLSNGFGSLDKFRTLSTQRPKAGYGDADGEDCGQVVSTGPFQLAPGKSLKIAFALLAGDDVEDLKTSALSAQARFDGMISAIHTPDLAPVVRIFPNPTNGMVYYTLPVQYEASPVKGVVYDFTGKKWFDQEMPAGSGPLDLSGLPSGAYVLRLEFGTQTQSVRIMKF